MLKVVLLLAFVGGALAAKCALTNLMNISYGGLYVTDGQPGISIELGVNYDMVDGNVTLCEIFARFPYSARVQHCVPGSSPLFCPPGDAVIGNFPFPTTGGNLGELVFKAISFGVNKQGHTGGNYHAFPGTRNSWAIEHVDVHFCFISASVLNTLVGWTPGISNPPADINTKCSCEPKNLDHIPDGHFSEHDCVPGMGRHWPEDKLEDQTTFDHTPAHIYGSYDCEVAFWEPMVSKNIFDYISGISGQSAAVAWPQPRTYHATGLYPMKYFMRESNGTIRGLQAGRVVEVGFQDFVRREVAQPCSSSSGSSSTTGPFGLTGSASGFTLSLLCLILVFVF